ncbi:hypothetical protein V2H45_09375 [Tumidithrix elongata RA019]|uniref:Uncharacterized protein n=1 Tax=Tumidithrix elongata BACA0141 TaxID=2716417 RepID=A0AAW9PZG6_9CYAN|nr:hypothetical protein [Tumidithrix elongata RA019]
MKTFSNCWFFGTTIACVVALMLGVYPGVLEDVLFLLVLLAIVVTPIAMVAIPIWLTILARKGKLRKPKVSWRLVAAIGAIVLGTTLLLQFDLPLRLVFMVSQPAFEALIARPPTGSAPTPIKGLNQQLGLYQVDEYATGSHGGVYFRVYQGKTHLFSEPSYGFAYRPSRETNPFGEDKYQNFPIKENWYWFKAFRNTWL